MFESRPKFHSLEIKGIFKSFGSVRALEDVNCTLIRGEVHAILGENGAGKSTLASILSGFVRPDLGLIHYDSDETRSVPFGDPGLIRRMGIELVHQHFTLVPDLTVEENLALSQIPKLVSALDVKSWARPGLQIGEELGWTFKPKQKVRNLSVGEQQRLEIIRVLGNQPDVVIFDEPTSVLAPDEVEDLLRVISDLRSREKAIVLIAHKLAEVMAVADRVTVLRKGRVVASALKGGYDAGQLAEWMVGEMPEFASSNRSEGAGQGLSIRSLTVEGDQGNLAVSGVSFEVERGSIVGIGGVDGNGQLELAEAVAQVRPLASGVMLWKGEPVQGKAEIGFIPQDRTKDGIIKEATILDNLMLSGLRRKEFWQGAFIRQGRVDTWARSLIDRFSIKADSALELVGNLSGGNQQKVVVSRTLDRIPEFMVACNPSRGLDVKATDFVHSEILRAKGEGCAVLLISSDLDELRALADKTYFLSSGKLAEDTNAISFVGGISKS